MKVGVVALQGAVSEHITILQKTFRAMNIEGITVIVRRKEDVADLDALIIPGGESTTICRLLKKSGLLTEIKEYAQTGLALLGTCAGCIALAKKTTSNIETLNLMDIIVVRNAFGRQRESFEMDLIVDGFDTPYHAVFIRAPLITGISGDCKPLAKIESGYAAVIQKKFMAVVFHPELTNDVRIHKLFLSMV